MKPMWKKFLTTGALTAALSVAMILPASAASASTSTTSIDLSSYIQQWLNDNGYADYKVNAPQSEQTAPQPQFSTKPVANDGGTSANPETATNNSGAGTTTDSAQFTAKVIALVNQERSKAGLKTLTNQADLSNMALAKAKDMSNNNYFDHTSPTYGSPFDMMQKFGISYSSAGENIAMGQQTAEEVMKDWMNSQGHRENILNPNFTQIGVGYYNGYWVQEFIGK